MTETRSEQNILKTIVGIISEALVVDSTSVHAETKLFRDLAVESIDVVDVRFRMEQAFGIRIDQQELFSGLGQDLTDAEVADAFTVAYLTSFVKARLA